jgi:hypothetical protein
VKIQSEAQLIDVGVRDPNGHLVGRIAGVVCGPDPYTPRWLVVRLRWRRARRAVPAALAVWQADAGVQVPFTRERIIASPALAGHDLGGDHRRMDAYYAVLTA